MLDQSTESDAVATLRSIYNDNGVTLLCMDLISFGIDKIIYIEAIDLLNILLLSSRGSSTLIQQKIYSYLIEVDSILFFELIHDLINYLKSWSAKDAYFKRIREKEDNLKSILPPELNIFDLIQSMCDDGFIPNKNQFREQLGNRRSIDIFQSIVSYMSLITKSENNHINIYILTSLFKTVLRLVQVSIIII